MDMLCWKKVLLQWITECGFMDRNYLNIEQSDIDMFYKNFCSKHQKTSTDKYTHLVDFIKEFYPSFEINFDDENCLISADYVYAYSLLLHFSCVKHPEPVFHEICKRLPDCAQQSVAEFFKELLDAEPITKEILRHSIAELASNQVTSPRLNDSFSSGTTGVSLMGLSSASRSRCDSPMKTPNRCAGPQRISPSTPKSYLLEERTRELYNLRAQLETERYEKSLLEVQIKQNENDIQKLNNDHKKLLQQIQDLKNDLLLKSSHGTTNNEDDAHQIQKRILKELSKKEEQIIKLSDDVRSLSEEKTLMEMQRSCADKQIVCCMNRIKELEFKVDELSDQLKDKIDHIKYLTESKLELEQFISETRSSAQGTKPDFNASGDCLDNSFLRNSNTANSSNSLSIPENLGVSVVDVQLKEKEHENELLKEQLQNFQYEHKHLAKQLTKLALEFDLPTATSSTDAFKEESVPEGEWLHDDSFSESQTSCKEQFNILSSCLEKIDKLHKNDRNTIKQLQEQSNNLRGENENLSRKLNGVARELEEIQEKLRVKEILQQQLENVKEEMQLALAKTQNDFAVCEKQKKKLYNEVHSLQHDKEKLCENLQEYKTKFELQYKESSELLVKNKKIDKNEKLLQAQLQKLQQEFAQKSAQWEAEFKKLSEQIIQQTEDIEVYKQTEQGIKNNYEQILIKNEELKKEVRQAGTYLCDTKNELKEKENQLTLLGQQIEELKQKNKILEEKFNRLIEDHKQELLTSGNIQRDLVKQLEKLKEQLTKTELLMESKVHESELKQHRLEEVKNKVRRILKLFTDSYNDDDDDDDDGDVLKNIEEMTTHIKNMLDNNENIQSQVFDLKESDKNTSTKIEDLTKMLQQQSHDFKNSQEEVCRLRADISMRESEIEQLQKEQICIRERAKRDLMAKEKELQDRLSGAFLEHETFMERVTVELKKEKQHNNDKDIELILRNAECNDLKKKLNEAENHIKTLRIDMQQLQQSCDRLKQFETRVVECSAENSKLCKDIETFKQQVTQNAMRLVEADKALTEFMELTKQQNESKSDVEMLQHKLKQKENILQEMECKLHQQSVYAEQLKSLKLILAEQKGLNTSLQSQVEKLTEESEKNSQQVLKEQEDKLILLTSLEESADQLKLSLEEKQQQSAAFEQKLKHLKEQCDSLNFQNTKLQGDLLEREAELGLSVDELQQQKVDFQNKLASQMKSLSEKSEKLEVMDNFLIEILAIIEKSFNVTQELLSKEVTNTFKYCENKYEDNIQKLRKTLNHILLKQQQLIEELQEVETHKEKAMASVATLKGSNSDLLAKLFQQDKQLKETQERLENEEINVEKRLIQDVKRLEEDLLNLEKVNERLSNENVKIQISLDKVQKDLEDSKQKIESQENENLQIKEDVRNKSAIIETLQLDDKKLRQSVKEKSQQIEKLHEKLKHFESQLKEKTIKVQTLEKELQEAKIKLQKNQQNQQTEQKKLQEKLKLLQTSSDCLEVEIGNKNKELLVSKNKYSDLLQKQKHMEEQLNLTSKKLDEMLTNKLNAETKCEQLQSKVQQLQRDLDFTKVQLQNQQEDNCRLNEEIKSLKVDKQHLRDEVHENKLIVQCANDNVTQLIQQISSIRLEKESTVEENLLLRKQLEEIGKNQSSSETKMKSVIEKSQDLERKLLTAENDLKYLKVNLEKSENCTDKLQAENKKLRDNQEISTKRIEKLALKLGDSQAKSAKLERDNEKLGRTLEAHSVTVEALQKEKDLLQSEAKSLKERLSRAERGHEQLAAKVQNLEHLNTSLQQIKQKLEASEIDGKIKLNKLEKIREISEEKIRKITSALHKTESDNVKLNLEIGALNSELKEVKVEYNQEHSIKIEELSHKLAEAEDLNQKYAEVNEKLKIEMEQIRTDVVAIKQEKSLIEQQHETSMKKINQFERENTQLVDDSKNRVRDLEEKIGRMEEELTLKSKEIFTLQTEIEVLRENSKSSLTQQNAIDNMAELEDLRTKLSLAADIQQKDQEIISQLRLDNQILHSKYQESKQRALDAAKSSEERIKENRLELEGKLEKMKTKMKTLYTEEITKMKTKQDREMVVIKSEMEVLKTQNGKYEEHTGKLSNQLVRLNDKMLQLQKENAILSTKLKHVTEQLQESEHNNKRPTSIHVSTISSSTSSVAGPNMGPNLAMEDEEGEVFNNTYLTDLKNGRMSELLSRDVCVEELKYRNSLLPPHLRSTYAAQFNHEFSEDDLKEGPNSLDDSMSALLSTTAGGIRKKCTGVTHYKRPGPPTPSKNGRLSFGGINEPAREILKESHDTNSGSVVTSTKTPARFNFFASRFSMGHTKDEKSCIKKETDKYKLQRIVEKTKSAGMKATPRLLLSVGYTSTPRKSKVHYDQRRLLDQLMKSSPSPSPLAGNEGNVIKKELKINPPDASVVETPLTALDKCDVHKIATTHKTIAKRLEAIAGGIKRCRRNSALFGRRLSRRIQEVCTPTSGETTSSALSTPAERSPFTAVSSAAPISGGISKSALLQKRLRKKPKTERASRPSFYIRGNIFVKYRTPNRGVLHDLNRHKSRKQRTEQFNKGRNLECYKKELQVQQPDNTIKCNDLKLVEDTFTFGEEQFEHSNMENKVAAAHVQHNESEHECDAAKYACPLKKELVTSQDLHNFDRFIGNIKSASKSGYSSEGSAEHFEKLLTNTASYAPFEVRNCSDSKCSHSTRLSTIDCDSFTPNSRQHSSCSDMRSHGEQENTSITTATPHPSSSNPTCQLSRTIYGGTVIYNHRLPHINTTYVRKSSIYVKNRKRSLQHKNLKSSSSCNDVILITNQTITFVDIMRMWSQMNNSTRIIVCFAILASFTTLLGTLIYFCSKRS